MLRLLAVSSVILTVGMSSCGNDTPPSSNGSDGDTDGDTDGDSDGDSDGDTSCFIDVLKGEYTFQGVCQDAALECTSGSKTSTNCDDGQICCILSDQCETVTGGLAECSDTECASSPKPKIGCPDSQWCCLKK